MKVLISALLILALLSSVFTACGRADERSDALVSVDTNASDETEPQGDKHDFELTNYDGRKFTILYPKWSLYNDYYFAEEANADAMNDAIYERTTKIEEALNIKITSKSFGYIDTVYPAIRKAVAGGLDVYDLALTHCVSSLPALISDKLIINWNDVPVIDMNKSYWNKGVKNTIESNGLLAFAANDFILPDVNTIFFNKTLLRDLTLESPYDLVNSGKWTWDKVIEMSAGASADLNGDSKYDEKDRYGFVGDSGWQLASITTGCDQYIIEIQDGQPVLAINTEKMASIVEKLHTFLHNGKSAYAWPSLSQYDPNQGGTPPIDFNDGRALYYLVPLSLAGRFRAMDVDFGILPMPKYNEEQIDYLSLNWAGYMCIPSIAGDLEYTGKVVELLGYYNRKLVRPAFYNILLGQKISRDEESRKMLDIVFDNAVYDLGIALNMYGITEQVLAKKMGNFESFYAKSYKVWNKTIEQYAKACSNYMAVNG